MQPRSRPLPADLGASVAQWLNPKESSAYSLSSKQTAADLLEKKALLCDAWTRKGAECYVEPKLTSHCQQYCDAACPRLVTEMLEQVAALSSSEAGGESQIHLSFPLTSHTYAIPWKFFTGHSIKSVPFSSTDSLLYRLAGPHWGWVYDSLRGSDANAAIAHRMCLSRSAGRRYQLEFLMWLDSRKPEENDLAQRLSEEMSAARTDLEDLSIDSGVPFVWADPRLGALGSLQWTVEVYGVLPVRFFMWTGVSR